MNIRPAHEDIRPGSPRDDSTSTAIGYTVSFLFGGSFLGIVLALVGLQIPTRPITLRVVSDIVFLFGIYIVLKAFYRRDRSRFFTVCALLVAALFFGAAQVAIRALATLATTGAYGSDESGTTYFWVESYLLFGILWLLVGIPYRAHIYKLDESGEKSAQRTLLEPLAVAAAALTGVFIILLWFGRGPFNQVSLHALIVGDIFTVFLIFPVFRFLAKACWQDGFIGLLFPRSFKRPWRQASREIVAATEEYQRREEYRREQQYRRKVSKLYGTPPNSTSSDEHGSGSGEKMAATPVGTHQEKDLKRIRPVPPPKTSRQAWKAPKITPNIASSQRSTYGRASLPRKNSYRPRKNGQRH